MWRLSAFPEKPCGGGARAAVLLLTSVLVAGQLQGQPSSEVVALRIEEKGDVYKDYYRGLYCVSCETFYQEKDLVDGKCPTHKKEPDRIEEENYFFRLTKYREPLLEHIAKNPRFILPEIRKNEVPVDPLAYLSKPTGTGQ